VCGGHGRGNMSTVSYTGTPALTEPVKTLSDGSVLVGPSGGLQFHLLWDPSVAAAPATYNRTYPAEFVVSELVYAKPATARRERHGINLLRR
jgi:hypothetical protein